MIVDEPEVREGGEVPEALVCDGAAVLEHELGQAVLGRTAFAQLAKELVVHPVHVTLITHAINQQVACRQQMSVVSRGCVSHSHA
jgi:hypothetical protein